MTSVLEELKPMLKTQTRSFYVPKRINQSIPREALKRYLLSNAVKYKGENCLYNYLKTLSSTVQDMYARLILRFSWIVNMTISDLVELGKKDVEGLNKLLSDFEDWILEEYKNPSKSLEKILKKSQLLNMCKGVKGLLRANGVSVDRKIFQRIFNMHLEPKRGYVPTKEEIKKFYAQAGNRLKLIIQFLTNVPLRRKELLELKWSDLNLKEKEPILVLKSSRLKGGGRGRYEGCTFAMVICDNLRQALKKRKEEEQSRFKRLYESEVKRLSEKGLEMETIKKKLKHLEWSDEIHVFLSSYYEYDEEKDVYYIKPLSWKTLGNEFNKLAKKTGIPITVHSFRYYVESTILSVQGRNSPMLDLALGHKPMGVRSRYGKLYEDKAKMRELFKELEPYLDLLYEGEKKEQIAKKKFREALAQGKNPDEAFEIALKTYEQFLLRDFHAMKEILKKEMKEASKQYEKRFLK